MADQKTSLQTMEMRGNFIQRHIGPDPHQQKEMLAELGLNSLQELLDTTVPESILDKQPLQLTETISEQAVIEYLRVMRNRNHVFVSMIGMGYYDTILPNVIKRNVLENPGWYTAYTPYQAEVSQGRLQALLNFQQMIIDLTGMEIANASLLDEATAAAEAMTMSKRLDEGENRVYIIDHYCHPQTIAVMQTRAESLNIDIKIGDPAELLEQYACFGLLTQYPDTYGKINDIRKLTESCHAQAGLITVASDLLSLVVLQAPGALEADIVIGSSQRFGTPMGYGGPHAAFFATREKFKRAVPGRIIGVAKDQFNQPALRMALQTREQHIRREKATSNICTSQVLLAVISGFYAIYHGRKGLQQIAGRVHRYAQILALGLSELGFNNLNRTFFDTLLIHTPGRARHYCAKAREQNINLRLIDKNHLGIALDETTTRRHIRTLWRVFSLTTDSLPDISTFDQQVTECIPDALLRKDCFLNHPVFKNHHSETKMMRYMRQLARQDIALDRSMIPLGSCTMKLNSATELQALSYHEFNALHPFAPLHQTLGYQQLFEELQEMLCDLTGFSAFSFQPNAGSQGEYTGLLVIKKFHQAKGEGHRNICFIPASAHGTNPASATLAGLQVVIIDCDDQGNISVNDLKAKISEYGQQLATIMITYPSTHGVYEEQFLTLCALVHEAGGQVYLDGANFNALVGLSRPGKLGADVAHLNLHKTFSIPHGGGGPGAGPIGVAEHLAVFLPEHPIIENINPEADPHYGTVGTVSAAPWGSASILTISWSYIAMMGASGLKQATLIAILNANYIARRLKNHFPILYTGKNNHVAHECILDLREIKKKTGITVDDIAKRLIDYGFHAPTISFPVADTMMIEPTESEDKNEIDRFCNALINIRQEISAIENGSMNKNNNPLRNAPHTQHLLLENWDFPYSMQIAFFPDPSQIIDKYWSPVGRIDSVYGDRHFFCACLPPDNQIQ